MIFSPHLFYIIINNNDIYIYIYIYITAKKRKGEIGCH